MLNGGSAKHKSTHSGSHWLSSSMLSPQMIWFGCTIRRALYVRTRARPPLSAPRNNCRRRRIEASPLVWASFRAFIVRYNRRSRVPGMNRDVLRIIDANANRAREALRVVEDYARFVLDEGAISAGLKQIRHDLAATLATVVSDAIYHRDTPGDVGTGTKTGSELAREDVGDVVTAAGKRLGEALRTIEEYAKTFDPHV